MQPSAIVVLPPLLDHDAGFLEGVEHLADEGFVAQLCLGALGITVLLRTARLNVGGLRADRCDPVADRSGDELRFIVQADMAWHAAQAEQVREHVDDVEGFQVVGKRGWPGIRG